MVITYYYLYNFIKIAFDTDSFEDTIYSVLGCVHLKLPEPNDDRCVA